MPVFSVGVASFGQLADQKCCVCEGEFLKEGDILFQKQHSGCSYTFRVVFPVECQDSHFIHTRCLNGTLDDSEPSGDCCCPKDLCNRTIGSTHDVRMRLDKWLDIDGGCYPVLEMLVLHFNNGQIQMEYARLSDLDDKIKNLQRVIDDDENAKELFIAANTVLGRSYLFHRPEWEDDINRAIVAFQRVMNIAPVRCIDILEKASIELVDLALNCAEGNLSFCLARLERFRSLYGKSDKIAECIAKLQFLKAKQSITALGKAADCVEALDRLKHFADIPGVRQKAIRDRLKEACKIECYRIVKNARESTDTDIDIELRRLLIEKISGIYSDQQTYKACTVELAWIQLVKIEKLYWNREFIDLKLLNRLFRNLTVLYDLGGKELKTRIQSLENKYLFLLRGKFRAALAKAENILRTTGNNPWFDEAVKDWLILIKVYGNSRHKSELKRLTLR